MTHVLTPRYMHRTDDPLTRCHFKDLSGNGREKQITAEVQPGYRAYLKAYDHDGKLIFEHDTGQMIRDFASFTDPADGSTWLFYSYADQEHIRLEGVQFDWNSNAPHQTRFYDPIPYKRSNQALDPRSGLHILLPQELVDLNSDGRPELISKLSSSLPGDARGLVAHDFLSGRMLWHLKTEANISEVITGDFDSNGISEIYLGTRVEYSSAGISGPLDRSGGWLAVVDHMGNILFSERQFLGTGEVRLASLEGQEFQRPYLYCVNNTWGPRRSMNSVVSLVWNGKRLIPNREYATQNSFERSSEHANLAAYSMDGKPRLALIERGVGLVVFDEQLTKTGLSCPDFVTEILGVTDMDLSGKLDILVRKPDRTIMILGPDLHKRAELANPFPNSEKVWASFVGRGIGLPKGLAVCSEEQVIYYGFYRVQWYTLLWRLIVANSLHFGILMLALVLLMVWYIIYNWQSIYTIMPGLRAAILYLRDDDRLMYCNPYFLELVRAPSGQKKRSLKEMSPALSRLLMDFKASGDRLQSHELVMGEDHMAGMYRVSFFYRRNPVYRFLMIVIPVPTVNAAGKILWADTARRLSHHVRRHITNVILALPRLTDDNVDAAERKEYHQIISSEVEKIRVFTHSFQRFSELRDHDLRQHDVIPLIEHVMDHLHIPEGVKQIRNISATPTLAFLDPIRFEEALANILNNALDAMPEGGYLQVTLKQVAPHQSPKRDLTVLVEVEDSGKGIPAKYMDEIWQPFFTTKQSGTGIGLPESKKIMESMGGMITLHSEEGVGTTVSIWLREGSAEG